MMNQHSDPELRDLIQIFRKDPCDRTVGEQNIINDYSYKGGRLFRMVKNGEEVRALYVIPKSKRPFSIVHMDHVGPFVGSTRGNQELLVIVDNLTRFVRLSPVRNTSTQNVLEVMKSFVNDFGLPDKIISDRGNGMVERVNRTVLSTIAIGIEDPRRKDWDLKIKEVERDLNNAVNKTTNKTPFETLHGYSPRFHDGILRRLADEDMDPWTEPEKIQESVRTQIENKQEIMKTYYDKKKCRTLQFEVGEIVVMRHVPKMTGEPTKAQPKYRRPLIITEVLPSDTYRVTQLSERTGGRFYTTTAHISQLKSLHSEEDDSTTEESPDEESEEEDTLRRNPRRSCNAKFNRGRLKSRNGRINTRTKNKLEVKSTYSGVVGGFWERMIRMIKYLLRKILDHRKLNYEQLETYLIEVESTINKRPLTYITENSDDLIPLTPAMFLQDRTTHFPDIEKITADTFRSRHRALQQIKRELRQRFRKEYLGLLVQKGKEGSGFNLRIGDIVLIGNDDQRRIDWPMAKIEELIPGRDEKIRVARIRTTRGILIRPIQKIYPLEVTSEEHMALLTLCAHTKRVGVC
ncbi:hypothetical protein LAZ67_5002505 [Cordylochernes scorpioides]|uniref:Integrase catalytic domain-containing protein n=1 Tax=Cordylochernes scorpioides TaxID=51811 RepID=A0ABY6KIA3_9ARAC|nr:hypothetical protein LAZ67_5002505 [Cordylochernes scorpioides]